MKTRLVLVASIMVISAGIAWKQRRALFALEAERLSISPPPAGSAASSAPVEGPPGSRSRRDSQPDSSSAALPEQQEHLAAIEAILLEIFRDLSAAPQRFEGNPREQQERRRLFVEHLAKLSPASFSVLLERIRVSSDFPPDWKAQFIDGAVECYSQYDPGAVFFAILPVEDLPDRERWISLCFQKWSVRQPTAALRWFKERFAAGDPTARSSVVVESAIAVQASVDPAAAIDFVLTESSSVDAAGNFGNSVAQRLRSPREHREFFHALRRKAEAVPDSEALRDMRAGYVNRIQSDLSKWPVGDALAFLETELSRDEQRSMASHLVNQASSLSDRPRWAGWLLDLDLPDDDQGSLRRFIDIWTMVHPAAAREWLDSLPDTPLRAGLIERQGERFEAIGR